MRGQVVSEAVPRKKNRSVITSAYLSHCSLPSRQISRITGGTRKLPWRVVDIGFYRSKPTAVTVLQFRPLTAHIAGMSRDADSQPRPMTAAQEAEVALWRAKALERMPYFAPILFSL